MTAADVDGTSSAEPASLTLADDEPRTIADQFARARRRYAEHRCLLTPNGWLTFAETGQAADGAGCALAAHWVAPGDRVVLALPNSAILRILEQAVFCGGYVRVAVSARLHPSEIAAIAADAEARVVCCAPAIADAMVAALHALGADTTVLAAADVDIAVDPEAPTALPPPLPGLPLALTPAGCTTLSATPPTPDRPYPPTIAPDDLAMLLYSSGTTGLPKGVRITHTAWLTQTRRALAQLPPIGPGDVVLAVAPMSHFGGSIGLDCAVSGAATVPSTRIAPNDILDDIDRFGATVVPLAPVMLAELARAATDRADPRTSAIRAIPYGGSPIPPPALALAATCFPGVLAQFYGLAEALAPLAVLSPPDHDHGARLWADADPTRAADGHRILASAGSWLRGVEHRIVREELQVRGPVVSAGYWHQPERTTAAFRDGWFATGDRARFHGDTITILGRSDDVIVTGGFTVEPSEVEHALADEPGVRDLAVVGIPHPRWGHGVAVVVVLDPAHAAAYDGDNGNARLLAALVTRARASLADFKKPVAVRAVDALPRNAAGKVDRTRLRALFDTPPGTAPQAPYTPPRDPRK